MLTVEFQFGLLGGALLIFLSAVAAWLAGVVAGWWRRPWAAQGMALWARRLAGLMSLLNLAFVTGLLAALWFISPGAFAGGQPPVVVALFGLPLVAAAGLAFVWFLNYWDLLGFRF
jgi:hypothetical protein